MVLYDCYLVQQCSLTRQSTSAGHSPTTATLQLNKCVWNCSMTTVYKAAVFSCLPCATFLGKILLFHITPAWHQVVPNLFPLGPPVTGEVECGKNARVEDLHCSVPCTLEVSELPFECSLAGADLLASNLVPSRNFPQKNMWQKLRSCGVIPHWVYLRIICLLSDRLCMKMRAQHAGKHGMFHLKLERFINWKLRTKTTKN